MAVNMNKQACFLNATAPGLNQCKDSNEHRIANILKMNYNNNKNTNAEQKQGLVVTLPGLGFSEVQVVDAVEVHVLCVPGERALPHPEVKIRSVDSFDCDPTLSLHSVQNRVETANIPLRHLLYSHIYICVITA